MATMIQVVMAAMLVTSSRGRSRRCWEANGLSLLLLHFLLLDFLLLAAPASALPLADFYPFNDTQGDRATEKSDDGGSGEIAINASFPFFNRSHDQLYINNNGVISFLRELTQYRSQDFPLQDETAIIAPFWADVDVKVGGVVWYRESQDSALLQQATVEIRKYFPDLEQFKANWTFVATWDNVGFYGAVGDGTSRRNTFQCVLITNGVQSFAIFNYNKIQWITGSNSGGATGSGLGGYPAQVGFNAGDGVNFASVEGARTDQVLNLTLTSNVAIAGKWVFRVDSAHIHGTQEGTTQIAPTSSEIPVSSDVTRGSDVTPGSSDVTIMPTRMTTIAADTRTTQSVPTSSEIPVSSDVTHGSDVNQGSSDVTTTTIRTSTVGAVASTTQSVTTSSEVRVSSDVTHGSDVTPGSNDVTISTTRTIIVAADTPDSTLAIAALSVALLVLVLVLVVAVVVVYRRKKSSLRTQGPNAADLMSFPSIDGGVYATPGSVSSHLPPPLLPVRPVDYSFEREVQTASSVESIPYGDVDRVPWSQPSLSRGDVARVPWSESSPSRGEAAGGGRHEDSGRDFSSDCKPYTSVTPLHPERSAEPGTAIMAVNQENTSASALASSFENAAFEEESSGNSLPYLSVSSINGLTPEEMAGNAPRETTPPPPCGRQPFKGFSADVTSSAVASVRGSSGSVESMPYASMVEISQSSV